MKFNKTSFTLIELLLGISILSVISLTIYMTFANGIAVNRKAQNLENLYREVNDTMQGISLDLENMVSYRSFKNKSDSNSSGSQQSGIFSGKSTSLSLLLPTEEGLKIVRYALQAPESGSIYQVIVNRATKKNMPITTRFEQTQKRINLFIQWT